jgi:hypothetical protein
MLSVFRACFDKTDRKTKLPTRRAHKNIKFAFIFPEIQKFCIFSKINNFAFFPQKNHQFCIFSQKLPILPKTTKIRTACLKLSGTERKINFQAKNSFLLKFDIQPFQNFDLHRLKIKKLLSN